jgi:phosphoglycolate phosphatase
VPRGLIFDLDGTLVESLPGIAASLNRALAALGREAHQHPAVRGFIGDGAKMLVRRALGADATEELEAAALAVFAADYGKGWPEGTHVYPGMRELLAWLQKQGIPLAVLSNKPHGFTMEIVSRLFPAGTFGVVLGQQGDLPHKPDPRGALEIAATLGLAPADCVIIGDSTMDLETAARAGMKSIAVTWGYHDRDRLSGADHIVGEVPALAELLRELLPL